MEKEKLSLFADAAMTAYSEGNVELAAVILGLRLAQALSEIDKRLGDMAECLDALVRHGDKP